jgi:predicted  nucleic acid-binding Zn-ribbon protein
MHSLQNNFKGLTLLSNEFGFEALSSRLSTVATSPEFQAMLLDEALREIGARVSSFEEVSLSHGRQLETPERSVSVYSDSLNEALSRLSRTEKELSLLRSAVQSLDSSVEKRFSDVESSRMASLSGTEHELSRLRSEVQNLGSSLEKRFFDLELTRIASLENPG